MLLITLYICKYSYNHDTELNHEHDVAKILDDNHIEQNLVDILQSVHISDNNFVTHFETIGNCY